MAASLNDQYKKIYDLILEATELVKLPGYNSFWQTPINPATDQKYHAINRLNLFLNQLKHKLSDPRWLTYKQAGQIGCYVKQNSKSKSKIENWLFKEKKLHNEINIDIKSRLERGEAVAGYKMDHTNTIYKVYDPPKYVSYPVFDATQIEGLALYQPPTAKGLTEDFIRSIEKNHNLKKNINFLNLADKITHEDSNHHEAYLSQIARWSIESQGGIEKASLNKELVIDITTLFLCLEAGIPAKNTLSSIAKNIDQNNLQSLPMAARKAQLAVLFCIDKPTVKEIKNNIPYPVIENQKKGDEVSWKKKNGELLSGRLVAQKDNYWAVQKEDGKKTFVHQKDFIIAKDNNVIEGEKDGNANNLGGRWLSGGKETNDTDSIERQSSVEVSRIDGTKSTQTLPGTGGNPINESLPKQPDVFDDIGYNKSPERPGQSGSFAEHGEDTKRNLENADRTTIGLQGLDFKIEPGFLEREGGWRQAAKNNLKAVGTLKMINQEQRPATPEEQIILAKYVGWGASELANNMFPGFARHGEIIEDRAKPGWNELVHEMLDVLTPEEIKTAARSTQYAHYTSEPAIRFIYDALNRMGFSGGKILEPGVGTGVFIGLLPEEMKKNTSYTGIEMDYISAGITKLLYPNQNILQGDFTKQVFPENFFDAAIGNPPFGSTKILADPDYRKHRFSLHNYFFAKSIDRIKPGGLLAFITSRYTMDSQDDKTRKYLSDRADFLGAVRLPNTAFKKNAGTEVVTDVLFFQKRGPNDKPAGENWLGQDTINVGLEKFMINEYFVRFPGMVLGNHSVEGSMYSGQEYTVTPFPEKSLEELFNQTIENLPADIYQSARKHKQTYNEQAVIERDFNPAYKKEGQIYLDDTGHIRRVEYGSGVLLDSVKKIGPKNIELLKSYIKLRDALKLSHKAQLENGPWEEALKNLNIEYDRFVKKHGYVLAFKASTRTRQKEDGTTEELEYRSYKNDKYFSLDVEFPLVRTLEVITSDGDIKKAPVLENRTINRPKTPVIESIPDALAVSLNIIGRLDIDHVAKTAKKPEEEVITVLGDLIYKNHDGSGYVLADEYLSGDVVKKLAEASAVAKIDNDLFRNVKALEKAQPEPLKAEHITVNPGMNWIPEKYYNAFASGILGINNAKVTYQEIDNSWAVGSGANPRSSMVDSYTPRGLRGSTNEWGTKSRGPNEIFESILNNRTIRVTTTFEEDGKKKTVLDKAATVEANEVAKSMRKAFNSWIWTDAERANELLNIYNSKFNTLKGREYDGSHLTFPGMSLHFRPHEHQKKAVWRILQTGNTYLGHAVGAGKTFTMIAAGMEMKRLGFINKPLYVVPNHMLGQFAQEFQELYPMADILVADEKNFHTDNRKRFIAQATLNNPDAIILTHSSFGLLRVKEETVAPVRDAFLDEMRYALSELEDEDAPRFKIKRMEKRIEQAEQRFDSLIAKGDNVVTTEQLGVDFLFLDEAHEFRKLDFITNRQMKGIDPNGSQRAIDLYIKTLWLDKENPGRSHVFASGTPITNTLGELYSVMRFFCQKDMEKDGIDHFDAWANMFGEPSSDYEMNSAGNYEVVERFSKFVNLPELMSRVRMFMDVLTSSELSLKVDRPAISGGSSEIVLAPKNGDLKAYQETILKPRIEKSKNWKPSKDEPGNPDPIINIITDGKLASIDMRFVNPSSSNNPDSKLNLFIDHIISAYRDTEQNTYSVEYGSNQKASRKGGVQINFFNTGFGQNVSARRGFNARSFLMSRLKDANIQEDHVAWIADYKTLAQKRLLFKDLRQGKKRILLGSAKKMGTGVNVQDRLTHLHYLDPPWYPADVEQPVGRIIRQGNQNKEASIKLFATKGSYDATMWQMVARKSKFIEQAFLGNKNVRSIEDVSETSQYEMAAAIASGDERAIRLVSLRADAERLSLLRSAHHSNQMSLASDKRTLEYDLKSDRDKLKKLHAIYPILPEYIGAEIEGKINGIHFDKRVEFGAALIDQIDAQITGRKKIDTLAEINGVRIYIDNNFDPDSVIKRLILGVEIGNIRFPLHDQSLNAERLSEIDPLGLTKRITNKINSIPSAISKIESEITTKEIRLNEINKIIGAPFEHAKELAEKVAETTTLEAELAQEDTSNNNTNQKANGLSFDLSPGEENQIEENQTPFNTPSGKVLKTTYTIYELNNKFVPIKFDPELKTYKSVENNQYQSQSDSTALNFKPNSNSYFDTDKAAERAAKRAWGENIEINHIKLTHEHFVVKDNENNAIAVGSLFKDRENTIKEYYYPLENGPLGAQPPSHVIPTIFTCLKTGDYQQNKITSKEYDQFISKDFAETLSDKYNAAVVSINEKGGMCLSKVFTEEQLPTHLEKKSNMENFIFFNNLGQPLQSHWKSINGEASFLQGDTNKDFKLWQGENMNQENTQKLVSKMK